MKILSEQPSNERYKLATEDKAGGATYTPKNLADFVARQIVGTARQLPTDRPLRVLDPAIGDGELLVSLLGQLAQHPSFRVEVYGFETNQKALNTAKKRLKQLFPDVVVRFELGNFLNFVLDRFGEGGYGSLFRVSAPEAYDLIIANPPYVRTQIMGATQARLLAKRFGLTGRVDLYYAFILGMARVLKPQGTAGIIVSNRFMTTLSGASVRRILQEQFNICHVWDLGDTKLFEVAVLPAVLLVEGKNSHREGPPAFTSIYGTTDKTSEFVSDPIDALSREGVVQTDDGRRFLVQHGTLDTDGTLSGVWRIATEAVNTWLATVRGHTWGTFRDIGKIRVGVKTCADKVFIRSDWKGMPEGERPEHLKAIITHHIARRFKGLTPEEPRKILYPHEMVRGRRAAVDLSRYPRTNAYLERYRPILESRTYLRDAGRAWYEIWVPQDPAAWDQPKLVFRDIADEPTFWIDLDGSVVNGDCYWLISQNPAQTDLLWLAAAIGNTTFIERFYDYRFHNKLYAGRRRFMTQYVEEFPLPDPNSALGQNIIANAKQIYDFLPSSKAERLQIELERLVWKAFGLIFKERSR